MIRLLLLVALLLLLYAILHSLLKDIFKQRRSLNRGLEPEELAQDPYCQIYIPKRTAVRKKIKGRDYCFCSKDCVRKFLDERKSQNPKDRAQRFKS
jgi:YHS domain-containing protein